MATITLTYKLETDDCKGLSPTELTNKVSAAGIIRGELDLLGYNLDSDTTTLVATEVQRVLVLSTTAQSDALFPTDAEREASVTGLYKSALNMLVPGPVSETIVIAP